MAATQTQLSRRIDRLERRAAVRWRPGPAMAVRPSAAECRDALKILIESGAAAGPGPTTQPPDGAVDGYGLWRALRGLIAAEGGGKDAEGGESAAPGATGYPIPAPYAGNAVGRPPDPSSSMGSAEDRAEQAL